MKRKKKNESSGTQIKHVYIKNIPVGITTQNHPRAAISVRGQTRLLMENITFENVLTPFDVQGIQSSHVTKTKIINDPKLKFDPVSIKKSTGWRRPIGPPLPIMCPSCGSISSSKNYVFGGMYFTCWNNTEECPNCNYPDARLSEGLFNLIGEIAQVLQAPELTHEMMKAITQIAEELTKGNMSPDEVISSIEVISPELASIIKRCVKITLMTAAFVTFLCGPIGAYYTVESYKLAKQQDESNRQQTAAEKDFSRKKAMERALESFTDMCIAPEAGDEHQPPDEPNHTHAAPAAQKEPPPKAGAGDLRSDATGDHGKRHDRTPPSREKGRAGEPGSS